MNAYLTGKDGKEVNLIDRALDDRHPRPGQQSDRDVPAMLSMLGKMNWEHIVRLRDRVKKGESIPAIVAEFTKLFESK
ncbi:MAG: hypothetical protein C0467_15870 [Planctomycetaceae bacterium]|nr:hypothetical protein [Planctomycetaceae bacterium]